MLIFILICHYIKKNFTILLYGVIIKQIFNFNREVFA